MRHLILPFLALLVFSFQGFAGEIKLGEPAPNFKLKGADGKEYRLSNFKGKIVVLEWINYGCPFVKKHYNSGNMQALQKKYTEKGVIWLAICSSAPGKQGYYSPEEINKLKQEKKSHYTAYLIDEDGTVGHLYGAKTTPHMYIIDAQGKLVYMGAIDDKPSTKLETVPIARNYVAEVLDQLLSGKTFKPFMTTPYGCSVKYKK